MNKVIKQTIKAGVRLYVLFIIAILFGFFAKDGFTLLYDIICFGIGILIGLLVTILQERHNG